MLKKSYLIIIGILCIILFCLGLAWATYVDQATISEIKQNIIWTKKEPKNPDAFFELAMSYAFAGRVRKGWKNLEKVDRLDKTYATKVIKKYSLLVQKDSYKWKNRFKLAFGYYFGKQKQSAINEFDKILKIKTKYVWALGYKALILGEIGQTEQTIILCKQALTLDPDAAAIHFLLSEAYKKKGQKGASIKELMTTGKLEAQDMLSDQKNGI